MNISSRRYLEVSVSDASGVQVLYSEGELVEVKFSVGFLERAIFLDAIKQVSSNSEFHDQENVPAALDRFK